MNARWSDSESEIEYLYREGELICEERELESVLAALTRLDEPEPVGVRISAVGLAVINVGDRNAADLSDRLAEELGDEVATPNHVLDAQGFSWMCPATEPMPWYGGVPELGEPVGKGHARIAVIDTGYSRDAARDAGYGRLLAVEASSEPDDEVFFEDGTIRPYGAHGTATTARSLAVAGVDNVTVKVRDCLVGGAVDEITIVEDLVTVIEAGVDIISIQAGLYTRLGHSPLAFNAFRRRVLSKYPDVVIVAAAGNNGSDQPFWPAAYDWTTAVGALTKGGDARTGWTNFGYWVDVYASGENVVVPFPNGTYEYLTGFSAEFTEGHALWSGTSFAAPVVAGLIARRMVERGITAPQARDVVLAEAAIAALPNTGPRVIV
ncbi:MAG: S8 family peptidase [Jiangellaceae bacterium]